MMKNFKEKLKIPRVILLILIASIISAVLIFFISVLVEMSNSCDAMVKAVDSVAESYLADNESEKIIEESLLKTYQSEVTVINHILSDYDIQNYSYEDRTAIADNINEIKKRSSCSDLFICDRNGTVFISGNADEIGSDLCEKGLLSKDQLNALVSDADRRESITDNEKPQSIEVENGGSAGCCFAKRILDINDNPTQYYLMVIYDMGSINSSITEWVDKTVLARAVSERIAMMDLVIFKGEDVLFTTIKKNIFTSADFEQGKLIYIDYVPKGESGKITLKNPDTGYSRTFNDCYVRTVETNNGERYRIIGILNINREEGGIAYRIGGMLWCCMALFVAVLLYVIYWFAAARSIGRKKTLLMVSGGVAAGLLAVFALFAYYFQSLEDLTEVTVTADKAYAQIHNVYENQKKQYDDLVKYYKKSDLTKIGLVAYDVEYSGDRLTSCGEQRKYYEADAQGNTNTRKDMFGNDMVCYSSSDILRDKTGILNDADIWILNDKGFAIASSGRENWSFNCNSDPNGDTIRKVMYGELPYFMEYNDGAGAMTESQIIYPVNLYAYSDGNGTTKYVGYKQYNQAENSGPDGNGKIEKLMGVLVVRTYKEPDAINVSRVNFKNNLETIVSASECSYADLSYDPSTDTVTISNKIQGNAEDLNLDEINVPTGIANTSVFSYFQTISRNDCYVRATKNASNISAGAIVYKMSVVHEQRGDMLELYLIAAAITIAIAYLLLYSTVKDFYDADGNKKIIMDSLPAEDEKSEAVSESETALAKGVAGIKSRLTPRKIKPLQIPIFIIRLILIITAGIFISSMFAKTGNGENGIFVNIYSTEWERCVNSYNIGAALALLAVIILVFNFIKSIVTIFCVPLGRKIETYARLVISIIQYVLIFVGVFYGAYLLGMELKSIGTFATVIAGVIGIGSQQLISDVGAGIAMLTEGRFMIGDLITIDGFTGRIKEIGIRSCIVESDDGIIKTVANGKMNNALLLSKKEKDKNSQEKAQDDSKPDKS